MSTGGDGEAGGGKDRIAQIIDYLNDPTLDELPDSLKTFKYTDGFDPDKLEEELQSHPFFMTELPDPSKPLPPLLEAFQQLKYSDTDNTPHELACNHKEDGMYHFKIKKYRIASTCFTNAISHELKEEQPDDKFIATLYNNRSACSWFIQNFRSCVSDCREALKHDPTYFKAFKRCVAALGELGKWGEVDAMCSEWDCGSDDEAVSFVSRERVKAQKGIAKDRKQERKRNAAEQDNERMRAKIMSMVLKERGIRVGNEAFLEGQAALDGRVVRIAEDGSTLTWPVLFMYPQYGQTDFIEAFSENDDFGAHLIEMLDGDNGPSWDVDHEYSSSNVEIYYLSGKLIRVQLSDSLERLMKSATYVLPSNGVPSFFVLAKGNGFCDDFKERIELS